MVKTIKEHNIPNNTCVIVSYNDSYGEIITLWNFKNKKDSEFLAPYVNFKYSEDKGKEGSFRFDGGCTFIRNANQTEINLLQKYLKSQNIDFKIPQQGYELW